MIDKNLLKKLKLIVFDVDGTLVNQNDQIGEETIKYVKALRNFGMRFSFASGRQHSALIHHAETLELQSPIISLDGTLIKSHPEGKIIAESPLPGKYVRKAIELSDKYLLKVALCHDAAIYYDEQNSGVHTLLDKYGAKYQEVDSYENYILNTLEIVIAGDYKDSMKHVNRKLQFPHSFGLMTSFYKSHSHGGVYYLEVRKSGGSKGKGLKKLTKYLKVKMTETAVIGDWFNDRSLFETKALKIAMGNAVPEIKKLADHILSRTFHDDGTAEFLEMVLRAKRN
ncbi:hydrolase (had superfamily) [hydrocarbon metagenome]|uniref:Hydrolase (Had superfamily) n=1 Tax=hydrocarbon metagenome TaxID=938273 RepID=A0A0W8FWY6_9ZZZZ